jgi:hypothetical protein
MKLLHAFGLLAASFVTLSSVADAGGDDMLNKPFAYIVSPKDGDTVSSPITVKFGLEHMAVSPAGVAHENGGHHHLIVDRDLPDLTMPIPMDANHIHFGKGQTETVIELPPGEHTLQLLIGDHIHRPHAEPVYSKQITITVK